MRKSRRDKALAAYYRRIHRKRFKGRHDLSKRWRNRSYRKLKWPKRGTRERSRLMRLGRNPDRRMWTFMGYDVFPADRNSSGIRWYSRSGRGYYLKADTKNGMKQLIRAERGNTRYEGNPSKKGLRNRAVKLVEGLLYALRNNNIKQEQAAYTKLLDFCQKNNFDFNHVYDGAVKEIKKSIAANMNGLV